MGLYAVPCPSCGVMHMWFSGNLDQRCECCKGNLGANIRHEGGIPICGWCGFALIVGGPRQCCKEGANYDKDSTYSRPPQGEKP